MPKKDTKRILIVEDDNALNDAFSTVLTKEGFTVESAFNGKEALETVKQTPPDLILLDLLMPVMDGKEFLRKFDNKQNIPVIVFSNLDTKTEINEAMQLGATRYMLKALASPSELVRLVKDTL